jgi:hypothetical protein
VWGRGVGGVVVGASATNLQLLDVVVGGRVTHVPDRRALVELHALLAQHLHHQLVARFDGRERSPDTFLSRSPPWGAPTLPPPPPTPGGGGGGARIQPETRHRALKYRNTLNARQGTSELRFPGRQKLGQRVTRVRSGSSPVCVSLSALSLSLRHSLAIPLMASSSGVTPQRSLTLMSAPFSISTATTRFWFSAHARWSAVRRS